MLSRLSFEPERTFGIDTLLGVGELNSFKHFLEIRGARTPCRFSHPSLVRRCGSQSDYLAGICLGVRVTERRILTFYLSPQRCLEVSQLLLENRSANQQPPKQACLTTHSVALAIRLFRSSASIQAAYSCGTQKQTHPDIAEKPPPSSLLLRARLHV